MLKQTDRLSRKNALAHRRKEGAEGSEDRGAGFCYDHRPLSLPSSFVFPRLFYFPFSPFSFAFFFLPSFSFSFIATTFCISSLRRGSLWEKRREREGRKNWKRKERRETTRKRRRERTREQLTCLQLHSSSGHSMPTSLTPYVIHCVTAAGTPFLLAWRKMDFRIMSVSIR